MEAKKSLDKLEMCIENDKCEEMDCAYYFMHEDIENVRNVMKRFFETIVNKGSGRNEIDKT